MHRLYHTLPLLATVGCSGVAIFGQAAEETSLPSVAPLVSAGADREILRGFPTRLDSSATTHATDLGFDVAWEQIAGEPVYLSNPSEASPTFVAPLAEQILVFRLTASDGAWATSDQVSLHVRERPRLVAPQVRAGADRFLDYNEALEPSDSDVSHGDLNQILWERLEPTPVGGAALEKEHPVVFRLTAERDGLVSAPDYVVLYPYDEAYRGSIAPTASLRGPSLVAPGETFTLDASDSRDANGDLIHLRWVQTRGDPLLTSKSGPQRRTLEAPVRPQELRFRVFARDAALESGASEVSVVVTAARDVPPAHPGPDQRTRPNRTITLDAIGGALGGSPQPTHYDYTWTQTLGTPVDRPEPWSDRVVTFVAPAAPDQLAFAVVATDEGVESVPTVTAVTVVEEHDNLAPVIYLSADTTSPAAGSLVEIRATVIDPEADPIQSCAWSEDPIGSVDLPTCEPSAFADGAGEVVFDITAPGAGVFVSISLEACDDRQSQLCNKDALELITR